jgi:hypothetical protein
MLAFSAGKIERLLFNLKVLGHGSYLSPDSRQVAGEEGIDRLRHTCSFVGMKAARGNVSSNPLRGNPMVYFFPSMRKRSIKRQAVA